MLSEPLGGRWIFRKRHDEISKVPDFISTTFSRHKTVPYVTNGHINNILY
jgi:hypothetical protein